MLGRKGEERLLLEMLVALVLLAAFVFSVMSFLSGSDLGESYFRKFYAVDIASNAQIVASANGNLALRYDNLNPTLPITFTFDNGKIEVSGTNAPASPIVRKDVFFYGKTAEYPSGPVSFSQPQYLALRKVGESFAITEVESLLRSCPRPENRALTKSTLVAYLNVEGFSAIQENTLQTEFRKALESNGLTPAENSDDASLSITIRVKRGDDPGFSTSSSSSADTSSLSCLFSEQLSVLSNIPFPRPEISESLPAGSTPVFVDVTMVVPEQRQPSPQQIATALSLAIARYLQ